MAAIDIDFPDLADFCIEVQTGAGGLCVRFPGGATLCAQFGVDIGDLGTITRSALGSINAALTPLQPFFNVLDVLVQIVTCMQAIPDCIGPPPNPTKLIDCLPDLVKKLAALLGLIPQLSIPVLVADLLDVMIVGLLALRGELAAMIEQQARLLAAATRASELGNVSLQIVVDCATGNLDAQLVNKQAGMEPLNRLLGVVNALLKLAGLPPIPALDSIGELSADALAGLDASIQALETAKASLPV